MRASSPTPKSSSCSASSATSRGRSRSWWPPTGRGCSASSCGRSCDRQEAEDLAQDVFLRLYRSRKRYRPRAKLATWVFFIARNVGRNAIRRRRRKRLTPVGLPFDGDDFARARSGRPTNPRPRRRPVERAELAQRRPRGRRRRSTAGSGGRSSCSSRTIPIPRSRLPWR